MVWSLNLKLDNKLHFLLVDYFFHDFFGVFYDFFFRAPMQQIVHYFLLFIELFLIGLYLFRQFLFLKNLSSKFFKNRILLYLFLIFFINVLIIFDVWSKVFESALWFRCCSLFTKRGIGSNLIDSKAFLFWVSIEILINS